MKFSGFSSGETAQSRAQHGINVLTSPEREPWWKEFLSKFEDPVMRILITAAIVWFGMGALVRYFSPESPGIVAAVLLAAGLAFWGARKVGVGFDVLNTSSDGVLALILTAVGHQ